MCIKTLQLPISPEKDYKEKSDYKSCDNPSPVGAQFVVLFQSIILISVLAEEFDRSVQSISMKGYVYIKSKSVFFSFKDQEEYCALMINHFF